MNKTKEYWDKIHGIACGIEPDDHDCHLSEDDSCQVCDDIYEVKQKLNEQRI